MLPTKAPVSESEEKEAKQLLIALYSNLAACQLQQQAYHRVIQTTTECLALDPDQGKALFRRGVALSSQTPPDLEAALVDLGRAGELLPASFEATIQQHTRGIHKRIAEEKKREEAELSQAYSGMFI